MPIFCIYAFIIQFITLFLMFDRPDHYFISSICPSYLLLAQINTLMRASILCMLMKSPVPSFPTSSSGLAVVTQGNIKNKVQARFRRGSHVVSLPHWSHFQNQTEIRFPSALVIEIFPMASSARSENWLWISSMRVKSLPSGSRNTDWCKILL